MLTDRAKRTTAALAVIGALAGGYAVGQSGGGPGGCNPNLPAPTAILPDFEGACPSPPAFELAPRSLPYANGRIPPQYLAPIYQGQLLKTDGAARDFNAMNVASRRLFGVTIRPLGSLSSYRNLAGQYFLRAQACARGHCWFAAVPGTSNHGWGLAIDLATRQMRAIVDRIGARFGWAKRCSDASFEWWHVKHNRACTGATYSGPDPGPLGTGPTSRCGAHAVYVAKHCRPILRRGSRGHARAVRLLQRTLHCFGAPSSGRYDLHTQQAVRRFQRYQHVHADAVVGRTTWQRVEYRRRHRPRCS